MRKNGLGKGLGALLPAQNIEDDVKGITELNINEIEPNRGQPRKYFDDEKLNILAESIKEHGIVQPIIVKKEENTYIIVAGERRWRAARIAGLKKVPVIIKDISNRQVMEIALIENLQREDLNPIEEAEAYEKLIREFELTQEEVSKAVGKSRSAIANSIRLLGLTEEVKKYLINGQLSSGHARALLSLDNFLLQQKAVDEIINSSLSVRETEKLVKKLTAVKNEKKKKDNIEYLNIEDKLKEILGTKVQLIAGNKKGKILIEYYSNEELERLLEFFEKAR